jgi:hypothetical protein
MGCRAQAFLCKLGVGGWGRDPASCTETQEVAPRTQRKHFSVERAVHWLSDPRSDLYFVVDFLLSLRVLPCREILILIHVRYP